MDRLLSLLRCGSVAGVSLGCGLSEVLRLLGDPQDKSVGRPLLWKYGALELAFEDSRVVMVLLTAEGDGDPGWPEDTDRTRVERVLSEMGLPYELVPDLTFETQSALRVQSSGTVVVFDAERGESLVKAVASRGP
jgi:hypothetical protein